MHLIKVTGNKVLRLKRLRYSTSGKMHLEVGNYVRTGIGEVLLLNVARSCDKREEKLRERLQMQNQELQI
jgi:hypothetical protein